MPVLHFNKLPDRALAEVRKAVDSDDSFRGRVLESLTPADLDAMEPGSRLFLERPDGWAESLELLVGEASDEADRTGLAKREAEARRNVEQLEETVGRLRSELEDARAVTERLRSNAEAAGARREQLEAENAALAAEVRERTTQREEAVRQLGEARNLAQRRLDEVQVLEQRIEALGDPPSTEPAGEPVAQPVSMPDVAAPLADAAGAAEALADSLRQLATRLGGGVHRFEPVHPPEAEPVGEREPGRDTAAAPARPARRTPVRLGRGLSADSPEGLDEYLRRPETFVIIDGYNVSMAGWPSSGIALQRESLLRALGALAASAAADIHVVFDGSSDGSRPAVSTPLPVRVHFTEAGVEADDRILEFVDDAPLDDAIVVVSSDGRVRDGARQRGAVAVSSQTLLARIRR